MNNPQNAGHVSEPLPHSVAEYGIAQVLRCSPTRAVGELRVLAQRGIAEAQVALGQYLLYREGRFDDAGEAYSWFQAAACAGDVAGMNMLGRCLERGWGVAADPAAAVAWYARAAEAGLDWAQYNLGNAALRGRGMSQSHAAAHAWFSRAAAQGHAKSMNLLGRCLEEGWGVAADRVGALDWYRRSAEAGDYRGQFNWGTCLARQGRKTEAAEWFTRAAHHATADLLPIMARALAGDPIFAVAASITQGRMSAVGTAMSGASP